MEFVAAVGSMIFGGGATGAAAGAGAAAAGGGSSLLTSIVQGGLTAFSAASAISQGIAAKSAARVDQLSAAAEASREKVAADDEAIRINRAIAETVGEQSLAFAAAGIDLSSGTPLAARQQARQRANEDLSTNRFNRNSRVAAWNQRALAARQRGKMAMAAGQLGALSDVGNFALDVMNRGGPAPARSDPWAGTRRVTA